MNRSRALLKSALAGVALLALVGVSTPARAQAPGSADAAGTSAAPSGANPTPASPAASPAAAASAPAPGAANEVTLDTPPEPSHRTAWPWIIIGTGIALVVTATVLEVHAVSEDDQRTAAEDKLFSLPQGDPQRQPLVDAAASHDKSATNSRTEALIIGSVGFVAIAGAVVLWFVEGGSSGASASASASASNGATTKRKLPSIVPRLAPGYAGAMLGATF